MHLRVDFKASGWFSLPAWMLGPKTLLLVRILMLGCSGLYLTGCGTVHRNIDAATEKILFDTSWAFYLGNPDSAALFNDTALQIVGANHGWRQVDLPHDWSIEGTFDKANPAGNQGGALPGGVGWYQKQFVLSGHDSLKNIYIQFDGVYRYSKVWLNGHFLGERPNGFISFEYNLSPYLYFDGRKNILVVRVDNSEQPNSRW